MYAAVVFSAALHGFLIFGFSLPVDPGPGVRATVIDARLVYPLPDAGPRSAERPEQFPTPDIFRPAPVALSQPASSAVEEPAAVPIPTTVPTDPEPAGRTGNDAAIATIPDLVHYPATEIDIYPQATRQIVPIYPETVRDTPVAGSVTLLVLIDEVGKVVGTSIMDAAPEGVFEAAAQQALMDTSFYPARKDGRSVRSRVLIKVEFDPGAGDAVQ